LAPDLPVHLPEQHSSAEVAGFALGLQQADLAVGVLELHLELAELALAEAEGSVVLQVAFLDVQFVLRLAALGAGGFRGRQGLDD
jgi:hypothetical protein